MSEKTSREETDKFMAKIHRKAKKREDKLEKLYLHYLDNHPQRIPEMIGDSEVVWEWLSDYMYLMDDGFTLKQNLDNLEEYIRFEGKKQNAVLALFKDDIDSPLSKKVSEILFYDWEEHCDNKNKKIERILKKGLK